jgi:hypothetical protein
MRGRLLSAVLPMQSDVCAGSIEVYMLVDVIDPGRGNIVMMRTVRRTLLGQLDLVAALEAVDLSDGFSIGRNNIHMLPDQRTIRHFSSPEEPQNEKRTIVTMVACRKTEWPGNGLREQQRCGVIFPAPRSALPDLRT